MSATNRFAGLIAARARDIFGNVRITCGQTDEQIVSVLNPPINAKTFSRLIVTEQSMSAQQMRSAAKFAADQIGTSTDQILGYFRDPLDPAYDSIHQVAVAEIFRPTRKDLASLRLRLSRIEATATAVRIMHRSLPARLLTAAMVRNLRPPSASLWTRRLLTAWNNQQRARLAQLSQRLEIECCLLDTTTRHLRYATGPFARCSARQVAKQLDHLIYTCIEEFGIRIPIVDATDAAALRVLSMPWGHYESVAVYDRTASLRRDRHGNRFVYDTITRPDARRIVEQDAAYYERIASRSPDPTGHQTLLKLCL